MELAVDVWIKMLSDSRISEAYDRVFPNGRGEDGTFGKPTVITGRSGPSDKLQTPLT